MPTVKCLVCGNVRQASVDELMFAPIHAIIWHVIPCPVCGRKTNHQTIFGAPESHAPFGEIGDEHSPPCSSAGVGIRARNRRP